MTTEQKISDLLRITVENSVTFYMQLADHIDGLENQVRELKLRIAELEDGNQNEV